jgi:hypothetical protein
MLAALLVKTPEQDFIFQRRFKEFVVLHVPAGSSEVDVQRALQDLHSLFKKEEQKTEPKPPKRKKLPPPIIVTKKPQPDDDVAEKERIESINYLKEMIDYLKDNIKDVLLWLGIFLLIVLVLISI